ncbi:MAG: hypothetical protein PWR24_316 [Desulfonauticus sp.]|jgi:diguanylate cyclase (GGDEF)-like protein|nr:hypothetical protein [Desulfonauticus sp.]
MHKEYLDKLYQEIYSLEKRIIREDNLNSDKYLVYTLLDKIEEVDSLLKNSNFNKYNWKYLKLTKNKYSLSLSIFELIQSLSKSRDTDYLTTLYNRLFFEKTLSRELDDAIKFSLPLSLLLFDIDKFKLINDNYGHDVGDIALKEVALALKESIRSNDYACRIGGEEFAIILKGSGYKQTSIIAKRVLDNIRAKKICVNDRYINITLSCGGAVYLGRGKVTKEELFKIADNNLYKSKREGKDRFYISVWIKKQELSSTLVGEEEKNFLYKS